MAKKCSYFFECVKYTQYICLRNRLRFFFKIYMLKLGCPVYLND